MQNSPLPVGRRGAGDRADDPLPAVIEAVVSEVVAEVFEMNLSRCDPVG